MENRELPSLINRIFTPIILLVGGLSALSLFTYRAYMLIDGITSELVFFDKGSYYMLGVGISMLALCFVVVQEFWLGQPLTKKQTSIFSKLAISGVILLLVLPHLTHYMVDGYLKNKGYFICEEASHQWLFVRDIVYILEAVECSEGLKKK